MVPEMGYGLQFPPELRGNPETNQPHQTPRSIFPSASLVPVPSPLGHEYRPAVESFGAGYTPAPVDSAHSFVVRQSGSIPMATPDQVQHYKQPVQQHDYKQLALQPDNQQPALQPDNQQPAQQPDNNKKFEEAWAGYKSRLATIFQDIQAGSLEPAAESLLSISKWLLQQVKALGLNVDDQKLHVDRTGLWNNFNHAWLAIFQKQLDMMSSPHQLTWQRSLSKATMERMGDELVGLCDGIEKYGLVDYQHGVLEEEIISAIQACLELYD